MPPMPYTQPIPVWLLPNYAPASTPPIVPFAPITNSPHYALPYRIAFVIRYPIQHAKLSPAFQERADAPTRVGGGRSAKASPLLEASASNGRVGGNSLVNQRFQLPYNDKQLTGNGRAFPLMPPLIPNPPPPFCPLTACYFSPCPAKKRDPPIGDYLPQGKAFHRRENLFLNFQCNMSS